MARFSTGSPSEILSVTQLNRSVRDLLEHRYPLLWVRGEISNCIVAKSGHCYFVLKDAQAQIRCAMFRNRMQLLNWQPRDGMQVEVQGLVTLYENRGEFQLIAETLRQAGRGSLFEAFLRLKEKLETEGLFSAALKRPLPFLPRCIGIVTSPQAAALRDVLATLARRNPAAQIILYPTPVQGEGAGAKIAQAIRTASIRAECDVLIICRGGGSMEDLWAFNDEAVARAMRACPMPVLSGVGHETDFTIADFAADLRAPTPTAAAELASPGRAELLERVSAMQAAIRHRLTRNIEIRAQRVDSLTRALQHPGQRLRERAGHLEQLRLRLEQSSRNRIGQQRRDLASLLHRMLLGMPRLPELAATLRSHGARLDTASRVAQARCAARLAALNDSLEHLSPQKVLERGYSVVREPGGNLVRDASTLQIAATLDITFARGGALARVEKIRD